MRKLKTGDVIIFRKTKDIFSKLISLGTRSSYVHVGIVSSANDAEVKVAEALEKGFTMRHYPIEVANVNRESGQWLVRESKTKLKNVKVNILKYLGRPYGFFDIFCIAVYILTKRKIYKGSALTLICSEAVSRVLYDSSDKKLNLAEEFDKPYSYITPDDIFMSEQLSTL